MLSNAFISETLHPYIIGFTTAKDLWTNLVLRFLTLPHSNILQLNTNLQNIKKGTKYKIQHLQEIKLTIDILMMAGAPLANKT